MIAGAHKHLSSPPTTYSIGQSSMETHRPPIKTPSVTHGGNFEFSFNQHQFMLRDDTEAGISSKRSSPKGLLRADSEDPPPYGAYYRQDSFWKSEQSL